MNRNIFLQRGNSYNLTESNFSTFEKLPNGIFNVVQDPDTEALYLEKIAEKFEFDFKLYGVDDTLIKHVVDTYKNATAKHNLGVLLNGAKGTGKTVTAKLLANKLDLPVIVVSAPYRGLSDFISKINQDCIFFFDEFEKNFATSKDKEESEAGGSLLSIMDGVYNGQCTHIFILTTNQLSINDNLISRPSRIRYIKSFGDVISKDILESFVKDNLEDMSRYEEIMEFVDSLEMATIDIVKSIVEEVNIHKCPVSEFKDFFNVRVATYTYYANGWNLESEDLGECLCEDEESDEYLPPLDENKQTTEKRRTKKYTKKDFVFDCTSYGSDKRRHRPWFKTLEFLTRIQNIKEGDTIGEWVVEEPIDESGVIVLHQERNIEAKRYYYIENPEASPSLFKGRVSHNYDCGYNDR